MRSSAVAIVVFLALLLLPERSLAQRPAPGGAAPDGPRRAPAGELLGRVLDPAGEGIGSVSVGVYSAADSSLVAGTLTGGNGRFRIEGVRPGRYYVRVSTIGHEPVVRGGVAVTPAAPRADLGEIRLRVSAVAIEGFTVTGERRGAALAPDRNTYNVRDMPTTTGGTATDVLRSVPAVEVDVEGRVSLRGNENVVVQINGRPSPMRGEQLGGFLAQLPADMIDRVEVIPNPSARYDPEGMAGIVNVVLRQNTDLGTSGGLTAGAGTTGQASLSGNLGYQRGPVTLFGSYGLHKDERSTSGSTYRENLFLDPRTYLHQDVVGEFSPLSHSLNTSAEYRLGTRDVLSTNLVASKRDTDRDGLTLSRELDAAQAVTRHLSRTTVESSDDLTLDYTLGFRHTVRPRVDELSAELRLGFSRDDEADLATQQLLAADGTAGAEAPAMERRQTDELTRNAALQLDYVRPLGAETRLETGYKGTLRRLDNSLEASLFSYERDAFVPDPGRSNQFEYAEQVHAVYGVLSRTLGKVDVQAGARAERAGTRFDLATTSETFDSGYTSLFPSALVAYNLDESRLVKASYSKRIERPRTRQLNPFGRIDDPYTVFRGNPYLRPEYTHAFEVGYQQDARWGSLQVTPFFRRTEDAVRRIVSLEDSVTVNTFRNVATNDSYGADLTGSVRLGPVTGFAGASAYKVVTDATNVDDGLSSDAFGWSARMNASWRVTPSLDAQLFFMYRAPMEVERGRVSGRSMANLAVRQRVFGDRASVGLRVVDPFNSMKFGFQSSDERFYQETERRFGARGLYATFSWNFGQQPRVRQRPAERPQPGPEDDFDGR